MTSRFEKPLVGTLGKDPETGSDTAFYDWVTDGDPDRALGVFAATLLQELRDTASADELVAVLEDWKATLPEAELTSRLAMLDRLMPQDHAYHGIKRRYVPEW